MKVIQDRGTAGRNFLGGNSGGNFNLINEECLDSSGCASILVIPPRRPIHHPPASDNIRNWRIFFLVIKQLHRLPTNRCAFVMRPPKEQFLADLPQTFEGKEASCFVSAKHNSMAVAAPCYLIAPTKTEREILSSVDRPLL